MCEVLRAVVNRGYRPCPYRPPRTQGCGGKPRRGPEPGGVGCGQASCREELEVGWTESEEGEWGEDGGCGIGMCKSLG